MQRPYKQHCVCLVGVFRCTRDVSRESIEVRTCVVMQNLLGEEPCWDRRHLIGGKRVPVLTEVPEIS